MIEFNTELPETFKSPVFVVPFTSRPSEDNSSLAYIPLALIVSADNPLLILKLVPLSVIIPVPTLSSVAVEY